MISGIGKCWKYSRSSFNHRSYQKNRNFSDFPMPETMNIWRNGYLPKIIKGLVLKSLHHFYPVIEYAHFEKIYTQSPYLHPNSVGTHFKFVLWIYWWEN